MPDSAVLHVTALLGGGVDRHLRDIARSLTRSHLFWHAGATADVVEIPAGHRFFPIDRTRAECAPEAITTALRDLHVGLVHLHSTARSARTVATQVARALRAPMLVTLHDVLFLRHEAFDTGGKIRPDPAWLAEVTPVLRSAAAVFAPSDYIAGLARHHVEGLAVEVVPNGSSPASAPLISPQARAAFLREAPRSVVAVLGAIGPHKGADLLEELPEHLEGTGIAIVVIGYLDRQLYPGWRVPGRLFVHGAFADEEIPGLLAAYGAKLALFPNRAPESFSYTLSDVWAAGVPALATRQGALAGRIGSCGGGWLLAPGAGAREVAVELRRLLEGEGLGELARVKSQLSRADPARVPALEDMARSLDAFYARFAIDPANPGAASPAALERLAAANLDGSLFRQELVRLADEYAQVAEALESERAQARKNEQDAREWIAKIERDVQALQAELEREVAERRRLGQEIVQLQIHKDAFDLLPGLLRRYLLKKILDARA